MTNRHPIPDAALEHHIAVLGKTGSGKSYLTQGIIERLIAKRQRVCVIDPTDRYWGLRLAPDGKKPSGKEIVIFGGKHADLPLGPTHGVALAEIVGTSATPVIIATRLMTVGQRTRFFGDFAEALLAKNEGPLHLVIDEAHLFAPKGKVNSIESGRMLHAANELVSSGRGIGLRIIMLTQRPAKLHNDSLTQVETLVSLRMIAPHDRDAVRDWVIEWADEATGAEMMTSLPSLPTGTAWVWAPELGVLRKADVPTITTYDSGKPLSSRKAPVLAPIDLAAVRGKLEIVAKDAVENDPKVLKAKVAELARELQRKNAEKIPQNIPDATAIEDAERKGFERAKKEVATAAARETQKAVVEALTAFRAALEPALTFLDGEVKRARSTKPDVAGEVEFQPSGPPAAPHANGKRAPVMSPARAPRPAAPNPSPAASGDGSDRPLGAERKPLAVLASVHPAGMTEAQWAVGAGLKRKGGTWSTYVSRLRTAGRIVRQGDLWFATDQGLADLGGDVAPMPPPGSELVDFWSSRIPGAAPMLQRLADEYPNWMTRETLAEQLNLAASGGTFSTYLSRLRSPGLIEENGDKQVRAAPQLMEAA